MERSGDTERNLKLSTQQEENPQLQEQYLETQHDDDDSFVWDESSQLYYHARSGFYHDPNAGWYYSTGDGLYYKFEDGNYVLLDSSKAKHCQIEDQTVAALSGSQAGTPGERELVENNQENTGETDQIDIGDCTGIEVPEIYRPPSEWLEDTLIELYLSGYSNATCVPDLMMPEETAERDSDIVSAAENTALHPQGDDELKLDLHATTPSSPSTCEAASWDEENWRAQYGQVVQREAELSPGFPVVDLWDWSVDKDLHREGDVEIARLVGKLVQPSSKLHPSVASNGGRLKTAPIWKVHLDLVQVRSGQVYKLRSPNATYLATLSSYDASNPTKDWGYAAILLERVKESWESRFAESSQFSRNLDHRNPSDCEKKAHSYRDRAAERRALHGGYGMAPGQKRSAEDLTPASPPFSESIEEAAAEALDLSFGADSYAQKLLKNMGWKEGEALGKNQQGLSEPLQGVGNKGTAGLGWNSGYRK